MCHTPIVSWGHPFASWPFLNNLTMKNTTKSWQWYVPFMSLYLILAQWQCPVASSKALDFLHQAMHTVTYQRIAMAIKTASKACVFFIVVCLPVALAAAGAIQSK
jgi:hypothetical protein